MPDSLVNTPRPFTINDIRVGTRLFSVLVSQARNHPGKTIYYGDLLQQARVAFPDDAEVQRAVPIGIGMKLLFVQAFCHSNGYPNLACLAVNKGKQIPGVSYPGDWEKEMREVAAFDWDEVQPVLADYVKDAIAVATPRRRVRELDARDLLYAHFRENRASYDCAFFKDAEREEMVDILMTGIEPQRAFDMVLEAKAALA